MTRIYPLSYFICRTGICLGLFAMALQSLAGISHTGALAAAVTGNQRPFTGAFGLLQICTPLGIVGIDPKQSVPVERSSIEKTCPLCTASALGGFTFTRGFHASVPMNTEISLMIVARHIPGLMLFPGRKGLSRAPPA